MDATDHELLQNYSRQRSEPAFASLVARHVDLVYSAAIRQVRDAHLAKDVSQQVFAELARQAARMKPETILAAWLHAATRRRAIDVVRVETRRQQREQIALEVAEAAETEAAWAQIAPLLDEALQSLPDLERDAVLLRYFEDKSLREVGETLGISDDAAQKRVHRALERLRAHFVKRRVPLGAAGLAALLSGNAVQAAPAGLAAAVSSAALLSVGAGAGAGLVVVTKSIAMTALQKSLVAASLALGLGFGVYEAGHAARLQERLAAIEQSAAQDRLAAELSLVGLADDNARLRTEAERLRAAALAAAQAQAADAATAQGAELRTMADWLERVQTLKERIKTHPETTIPEMRWLKDEDWLETVKDNLLADDIDFFIAAATLRCSAIKIFGNKALPALKSYLKAHDNKFPTDLAQLQPYFDAPLDSAILERWIILPRKEVPTAKEVPADLGGVGERVITQKGFVDTKYDHRVAVGKSGMGIFGGGYHPSFPYYEEAAKAYAAANPGRKQTSLEDLIPYATTPEQKAAVQKFIAARESAKK